jgi:enoyl-CoA hydratase
VTISGFKQAFAGCFPWFRLRGIGSRFKSANPVEEAMSTVHYEVADEYARIRLSNGVTNTLTTEVLERLSGAVARAEAEARGVLLCGGEKFFSNGLDLDWALSQSSAQMRDLFLALGKCLLSVLEFPRPVVGAIRGHAAGGAAALFLACDYRYAASGRVLIGKPEVLIGVPNPYYGDQLLRFVAGDFVASDLIYTGRMVEAEEAAALQLVHVVGASTEIEDLAWERLVSLGALSPEAFSESKRMRLGRFCADVREQMSARVARQVEIWSSDEAQTRLKAAAARLKRASNAGSPPLD